MCSELECSICYRAYNVGRRFPRSLECRHTFCECCLSTMVRQSHQGDEEMLRSVEISVITCPLCRHYTHIPTNGEVRRALRADEGVLGQILEAGFLKDDPCDESDGEPGGHDNNEKPEPEPSGPSPSAETEGAPRTRKGKLWRSVRRLCGRLVSDNSRTSPEHRSQCMTNEEMKDIALMSCYMI